MLFALHTVFATPAYSCIRFGNDIAGSIKYLECLQEEQADRIFSIEANLDDLGGSTAQLGDVLLKRIEQLDRQLEDANRVILFLLDENKKHNELHAK